MLVSFSEAVTLPSRVTEWTQANEGKNYIEIKYLPNLESIALFEDLEISMDFAWNVFEVEEIYQKFDQAHKSLVQGENESHTAETELIIIKSLTLQLQWSDPLYVSKNIDRDTITVKVLSQMFECDPEIELSLDQIEEF